MEHWQLPTGCPVIAPYVESLVAEYDFFYSFFRR